MLLRVVVTRTQLTKLVIERNQGKTISMSAMKAGMSRNTARKYLRQDDVMEQRREPHTWRTREDPLAAIWPRAVEMLREAPELEAKALFEHLAEGRQDEIKPGLLRTFQRRVKAWRLEEGPDKEVFFTQEIKARRGAGGGLDGHGPLGITIQGKALDHKLFHAVLPYSNWEWAVRAQSESTLSLRSGLKATLGRLGRVPRELLTDHSSTATHQLCRDGTRRGFNEEYLGICAHYGLEPRTINVGRPQENGSCESAHGHLKRRIKQHLLLRGSRDFASEEEYDLFLIGVLESANRLRAERLAEELAAMRETAVADLPDYRELMVRVGNNSTIRLRKQVYSVPSRLIGAKLLARIYENRIVLLDGPRRWRNCRWARRPGRGDRLPACDRPFAAQARSVRRLPLARGVVSRAGLPGGLRSSGAHRARRSGPALSRNPQGGRRRRPDGGGERAGATAGAPRPVISAAEVRGMLDTWRDMRREWRERPPLEVDLADYDALLDGGEEANDATGRTSDPEVAAVQQTEVAHEN